MIKKLKITFNNLSEEIEANLTVGSYQEGLLNLVSEYTDKLKKIFIVHGEYEGQKVLSELINTKYRIETEIPDFGEVFEIKDGIVTATISQNPAEQGKMAILTAFNMMTTNKVPDFDKHFVDINAVLLENCN